MCCRAIKTKVIEGAVIAYQSLYVGNCKQCDQILRNFAKVAKFLKCLEFLLG